MGMGIRRIRTSRFSIVHSSQSFHFLTDSQYRNIFLLVPKVQILIWTAVQQFTKMKPVLPYCQTTNTI